MRSNVDLDRLRRFLEALGARGRRDTTCFLAGGASAVFEGWRDSTVDVDLRLEPVSDDLLRAISELKHLNEINVEFAGPADFIPMPPGWEERSPSVGRFGVLDVRHIDFYAQALAKLERGHARDVEDVRAMFDRGLVERQRLVELFDAIEPELHRFPAIEPSAFRAAVEAA